MLLNVEMLIRYVKIDYYAIKTHATLKFAFIRGSMNCYVSTKKANRV